MTPYPFDPAINGFAANGELTAVKQSQDQLSAKRIQHELSAAFSVLENVTQCVTMFGSARTDPDDADYQLARNVAFSLGKKGFSIMTGGGPGIMEAANRGARDADAQSIGCHIDLPFERGINDYVDTGITFDYLFSRKVMFVRHASAFVVFPGGFGTLDEVFEILMLMQTDRVARRPLVFVGSQFWRGLLETVCNELLNRNAISPMDLQLFSFADDVDEVLAAVMRQ